MIENDQAEVALIQAAIVEKELKVAEFQTTHAEKRAFWALEKIKALENYYMMFTLTVVEFFIKGFDHKCRNQVSRLFFKVDLNSPDIVANGDNEVGESSSPKKQASPLLSLIFLGTTMKLGDLATIDDLVEMELDQF